METPVLDFRHREIQKLIAERNWRNLSNDEEKIKAVYNYVRDEIVFGYQGEDAASASKVLQDGYGQCNTKSNLLMALLRALDIPCRFHGFTIEKSLQKGAIPGIWFRLSPKNIVHSWVEVLHEGQWYALEGVILDQKYLKKIQSRFRGFQGTFCGYGIYTENLQNPDIDWKKNNTYIQKGGINQDFGLYDSPDVFYREHPLELNFIKKAVFKWIARHRINRNVSRIRD